MTTEIIIHRLARSDGRTWAFKADPARADIVVATYQNGDMLHAASYGKPTARLLWVDLVQNHKFKIEGTSK